MRLSGRELAIIFAFWTSLATLSAVNTLIDPRGYGLRLISPAGPIAMAYIESWLWAGFTPLIFSLSSRFAIERSRWFVRLPALLIIGCLISLAIYFILMFARTEIFELPRRGAPAFVPLTEIRRFRFVNQLLVYFAVLAAGYAREYFLRDQQRQREAIELHAQLAEARLDALRAQINPHFLFNALTTIGYLIQTAPPRALQTLLRLTSLLRGVLRSEGEFSTLGRELDIIEAYLDIERARFEQRLRARAQPGAAANRGERARARREPGGEGGTHRDHCAPRRTKRHPDRARQRAGRAGGSGGGGADEYAGAARAALWRECFADTDVCAWRRRNCDDRDSHPCLKSCAW